MNTSLLNNHMNARAFIHAYKGGIYLMEIEERGASEWVCDASSLSPRRFDTLDSAKAYAREFGIEKVMLSEDQPVGEMIGLASPT